MLIRFIIIIISVYFLYRIIKLVNKKKRTAVNRDHQYGQAPSGGEDLMEDPFCHIYIPLSQACKKEIAGKIYYFCSKECCESYILMRDKER
jgi:uncharacterized protein